ncbi:hypothetical protein AB0395_42035 [Streptosporangium sp. NPDC051023]|uniref:hypothetical protein n=1 Tax=Streptosporangium sp. NPDC051023 TaxID=3155410 RepID=UPI00344ED874
MNDRSEAELIRLLADAADAAPEPKGDLAGTVQLRRSRRRTRRRLQSALAVAGVVTVVAGGTAVGRGVSSGEGGDGHVLTTEVTPTAVPSPEESSGDGTSSESPTVRPAAEVWPATVSWIPAKAADGSKYRPITGLSATELLLSAESSFEKVGRLEVYDTMTGRSTVLTQMPTPKEGKDYYTQDVEAGTDYIAWWGETPNTPDKWADFWVVPRAGGTAKRVGEVTGALAEVTRIGVTADSLVWSVKAGGVYRMPLSGGAPGRIAGTDGLHLLSWPWAADVDGKQDTGAGNQTKLVNLETGTTTEVNVPKGVDGLRCGPVWCFGAKGDAALVQRVDGSDRRTVPGLGRAGGSSSLLTGRTGGFVGFFGYSQRGGTASGYVPSEVVYDPISGMAGGIGDRTNGGGYGVGVSSSPTSIVYWDADERQVEECGEVDAASVPLTRPSGAPAPTGKIRTCAQVQKGGGKEFTVVNLLALPYMN